MKASTATFVAVVLSAVSYAAWNMGLDRLFDPLLLPSSYIEACKDVGVRIHKHPPQRVQTVFLSYEPNPGREIPAVMNLTPPATSRM